MGDYLRVIVVLGIYGIGATGKINTRRILLHAILYVSSNLNHSQFYHIYGK